jgi:hypothetical protein
MAAVFMAGVTLSRFTIIPEQLVHFALRRWRRHQNLICLKLFSRIDSWYAGWEARKRQSRAASMRSASHVI